MKVKTQSNGKSCFFLSGKINQASVGNAGNVEGIINFEEIEGSSEEVLQRDYKGGVDIFNVIIVR